MAWQDLGLGRGQWEAGEGESGLEESGDGHVLLVK